MAPKIDLTNIPQKIVHVHRGKPIDLNIPIKGKPQPVCSWFFGSVKLKDSLDRIKMDSNGQYTRLVIRETTINDTGNYTLEVKNAVGTAREVIKVIILGKNLCTQMKSSQFYLYVANFHIKQVKAALFILRQDLPDFSNVT